MLTFKQYLFESEFKHYKNPYSDNHRYTTSVGQHKLDVEFHPVHDYDTKKLAHDVEFIVNNSDSVHHEPNKHISPLDKMAVLKHVHKAVHTFVKDHKPQQLNFKGNNEAKHKMYGMFASAAGKRYGAKVHGGDYGNKWKVEF